MAKPTKFYNPIEAKSKSRNKSKQSTSKDFSRYLTNIDKKLEKLGVKHNSKIGSARSRRKSLEVQKSKSKKKGNSAISRLEKNVINIRTATPDQEGRKMDNLQITGDVAFLNEQTNNSSI